ncbi:hypothetical protein FRC17_007415, partial [Serendipita sp. 399]
MSTPEASLEDDPLYQSHIPYQRHAIAQMISNNGLNLQRAKMVQRVGSSARKL